MANHIKIELEQNKLRLEYFKVRNEQTPNHIYAKWVDIYASRVKKLERQFQKLEKQSATKQ